MPRKESTTTQPGDFLNDFDKRLAAARKAIRRSKEASAAAQTAQTHHDKKWQERQLEELKEVKESRRQTRERMAEFHKVSMGILSRLEAEGTEAPADNQDEQPVSPKDRPERNTWQKKLDDPKKYPWMTIAETQEALGGISNSRVYALKDEGKLKVWANITPIRITTESVMLQIEIKTEKTS